jgi:exopolysaccharide production protein ExoZ
MLINVQLLRFAAALAVVFYHANKHLQATGADPGWLFAAGEAAGFAGVDVFFVISGFIMFYTTRQAAGAVAAADFLKRRLARIYSGYWPFFPAAVVVFAWARPEHYAEADLPASLLLWPTPLNRVLLDVSWTLSYEMYFYLLFTLLVLLRVPSRTWLVAGAVLLVASYNLARHFLWQDFSPERFYSHSFASHFLISPFLLEFFLGALLGALLRAEPRAQGSRRAFGLAALTLGAGISTFAAAGYINAHVYQGGIEQGYHVVPRVLLFGLPSALILLGLVGLERGGWVAPRRFSLYTGGASYAIYLSHTIFLVASMKLGLNLALTGLPDPLVQAVFLAYCALITVFSVAWYRFAERPLHGAFKRAVRVRRAG